ncbi:MAG: hypothetical protein H6849_00145 [Alphaproteobacteria bacterium]|nr:MAG: hypothetical protein H6849_00145 [Alphaproteobacteria bacterium]
MAALNFSHLLKLSELVPGIFTLVQKSEGTKSAPQILNKIVDVACQISGKHDFESMVATLKEKPELLLEFHREILHLERDTLSAEIEDRRHARDRDAEIIASGQKNKRADVMILLAVLGLVTCLLTLGLYRDCLPGEAIGIISTVSGIFGACLKDAFAFEFGSSRGVRDKNLLSILNHINNKK